AFSLTSCNDDKVSPISLKGYEGTDLSLYYPDSESHSYELTGGEGAYEASSSDTNVVTAGIDSKGNLAMKAIAPGKADVTVTDEAENKLVLKVVVAHPTLDLVVEKLDVTIKGEELTDDEKKEIGKEALNTILVQAEGGYKFTYTNEARTEGVVNVYAEKFGDKAVSGEFRIVPVTAEEETEATQRQVYELTLDKSVRTLILETTTATRAHMTEKKVSRVLLEDVTADFEEEYEGVEEVYTVQTIASDDK
ncbi:MAG: hypothetical protein LIP08_02920, partial [Bacteroides sp.]|nr:hypothetical protein [Bacteroides sp.]